MSVRPFDRYLQAVISVTIATLVLVSFFNLGSFLWAREANLHSQLSDQSERTLILEKKLASQKANIELALSKIGSGPTDLEQLLSEGQGRLKIEAYGSLLNEIATNNAQMTYFPGQVVVLPLSEKVMRYQTTHLLQGPREAVLQALQSSEVGALEVSNIVLDGEEVIETGILSVRLEFDVVGSESPSLRGT